MAGGLLEPAAQLAEGEALGVVGDHGRWARWLRLEDPGADLDEGGELAAADPGGEGEAELVVEIGGVAADDGEAGAPALTAVGLGGAFGPAGGGGGLEAVDEGAAVIKDDDGLVLGGAAAGEPGLDGDAADDQRRHQEHGEQEALRAYGREVLAAGDDCDLAEVAVSVHRRG
jgi:hypothetical protein